VTIFEWNFEVSIRKVCTKKWKYQNIENNFCKIVFKNVKTLVASGLVAGGHLQTNSTGLIFMWGSFPTSLN
jgi:hypothetical protein